MMNIYLFIWIFIDKCHYQHPALHPYMVSTTAPHLGLKRTSSCIFSVWGWRGNSHHRTEYFQGWKTYIGSIFYFFFYVKYCKSWEGKVHQINRNYKCHQCNLFLRKIFTVQLNQATLQTNQGKTTTVEKVLCLLFNDCILIMAKFHPFPMLAGRITVKCRVLQISKQENNKFPPRIMHHKTLCIHLFGTVQFNYL